MQRPRSAWDAGASTPELRNAGKIPASSGITALSVATAVEIEAGASLPILANSGEIKATAGGADGTAVAIVDKSGTLSLVENSGAIAATGAAATSNRNVAIDLSANTTGATVKQTTVAANFAAPSIIGDIRFGTGSDTLDIADGKLAGNVGFGAGNNRFLLSGDAVGVGNLTFGAGADTITTSGTQHFQRRGRFRWRRRHAGDWRHLLFTGAADQFRRSRGVGPEGNIRCRQIRFDRVVDRDRWRNHRRIARQDRRRIEQLNISGTASFAEGSKLQLSVANVDQAEGNFVVINAGTLTGAGNLAATTDCCRSFTRAR